MLAEFTRAKVENCENVKGKNWLCHGEWKARQGEMQSEVGMRNG